MAEKESREVAAARRPRLALPCTILTEKDTVRLVAGEDFRYTLKAPGCESWLPAFITSIDGTKTLDELLAPLPRDIQAPARQIIDRLSAERFVLFVEDPPEKAHEAAVYRLQAEGCGPLRERLADSQMAARKSERILRVLCQDTLDYHAALNFNRECLSGKNPWLWVTHAPASRAYVSPVFLPETGPCLECLVAHFCRLSPAPEIYDHLIAHAQAGRPLESAPISDAALALLERLVLWKAAQLELRDLSAALFRLHILELGTMEVSSHRVIADRQCPACGREKP